MNKDKKIFALIIMDGWGHRSERNGNAILQAQTPVLDRLWNTYPHTLIEASSSFVGLPEGQMGNSEVGHMTIGAGRVIDQDLTRIDAAINNGDLESNRVLQHCFQNIANTKKTLHLMGLLSPGGVHSHERHLEALIDFASDQGVQKIIIHAFLDGRDMPPKSAEKSIVMIDEKLRKKNLGHIGSIIGRYYAMDRDSHWDRIAKSYTLITEAKGDFTANNALEGLLNAYQRDESDEFVQATSIRGTAALQEGDALIFTNFRSDRAKQLAHAFCQKTFSHFSRTYHPALSSFCTMTQYDDNFKERAIFSPLQIKNSLGEWFEKYDRTQLRLAETEKYAHVTFFFNGGREKAFRQEERCLIPSPSVATYDLQPQMSAVEMTDTFVKAIKSHSYDVIICNYANGDMVGHTGNFEATKIAVETVDHCIGRVLKALECANGECLVTADHGNAEQMLNVETQQPHTAHTCNPVPLMYFGKQKVQFHGQGRLCDLAPTLLQLMAMPIPKEMTGHSLIQ